MDWPIKAHRLVGDIENKWLITVKDSECRMKYTKDAWGYWEEIGGPLWKNSLEDFWKVMVLVWVLTPVKLMEVGKKHMLEKKSIWESAKIESGMKNLGCKELVRWKRENFWENDSEERVVKIIKKIKDSSDDKW